LTEINEDALITSGGMTFVVRQLEGQGLIARRGHPKDGRSFLLRLTPKGRRLADRMIRAVADADAVLAAHLGRRDSQVAIALLGRLEEGVGLSDVERSFSR
jgi:DNA-binding MarR family transcriptional regulator